MQQEIKLTVSTILCLCFVNAQGQQTVTGKVVSCQDNRPLAFANITLMHDLSGTITDENGEFQLLISSENSSDSIIISYVGFRRVKMAVATIIRPICLEEAPVMLQEVVVRTDKVDLKDLPRKFRVIRGNLYAQNTETTLAEFNVFLNQIKGTAAFDAYTYDLSDYAGSIKEFYERYHADQPELKHSPKQQPGKEEGNYGHYPAINVSYEAAVAYCEWLTDEYNNQKKREFKKVKFRLPTLKEWQISALGYSKFQTWDLDANHVEVIDYGDSITMVGGKGGKPLTLSASEVNYPWYGPYYFRNKTQNSKHCFMGNFKVPERYIPCEFPKVAGDGFSLMGHVASYFPNDMGLYDVVGNVAEMIDQKGIACGGSWNDLPEAATIRSTNTYSKASATVGFRVFMEVVEK